MLPPLKNGTILKDRYILTDIVGQGGMGSVYRAEDVRLPGRLCAIKEVQPDPNASVELAAQAQVQFLQEASILAQLDHPNLPKVSDFFTETGRDYLVMDYVPGKDLKQILDESAARGNKLEEHVVRNWAMQIIDALTYLHNHNPPVLHRDIKPSNIKLTPDNRIKLVDFGLAKLLATDDMQTITVIQGRGTALYTPLEQYGGEFDHTNAQSDIYSLGATLYTLLTGVPPASAKERFLNPLGQKSPRDLNSKVSTVFSEAIMWALAMHPKERPADTETFRAAIQGQIKRAVEQVTQPDWRVAIRQNLLPLVLTLLLFLIAVYLTVN